MDIGSNKYINWLAKSSFAIYLIHCNVLILPFYLRWMRYLFVNYDGIVVLVLVLFSVLIIALCSILIDKVRLIIWNWFINQNSIRQ